MFIVRKFKEDIDLEPFRAYLNSIGDSLVIDDQKALAAGVHHAGLFQHRVLVDGVGQRFLALLARGNSGVILSLLFRGFSKAIKEKETMDGRDLAIALDFGGRAPGRHSP